MGGIYGERLKGVGGGRGASTTLTPEQRAEQSRQRAAVWQKAWKREAWNSVRARIEGDVPHITVWINDQLVTDFTDTENHAANGATDGMIAIQMHYTDEKTPRWVDGGFWRWRVIAVKERAVPLSARPASPRSAGRWSCDVRLVRSARSANLYCNRRRPD